MISKIYISGLKSINSLEVTCSKLNIITGTNSSGKSTFLQAIMLFFQSHYGLSFKPCENGLNGSIISLGEFRENKNPNCENIEIKIELDNYNNCSSSIIFFLDDSLQCKVCTEEFIDTQFERYSEKILDSTSSVLKHISCNRMGAQDVYAKDYNDGSIGREGEYAVYYLENNKSKLLTKELIKDDVSETLSTQVNYWLEYILSTTINTEDIVGTDIVKAMYSIRGGLDRRPKNVGSGVSYLISILVMCLSSDIDDILIIENPEIHLHPKAQSKVCEFLYFIANSGRQIFVETHSDHIFNGIRAGIANQEMESKNININFFDLSEKDCTVNTVVEFGKRGRILNNVEGLFDQFNIDLNRMLGI